MCIVPNNVDCGRVLYTIKISKIQSDTSVVAYSGRHVWLESDWFYSLMNLNKYFKTYGVDPCLGINHQSTCGSCNYLILVARDWCGIVTYLNKLIKQWFIILTGNCFVLFWLCYPQIATSWFFGCYIAYHPSLLSFWEVTTPQSLIEMFTFC